MKDYFFCYNPKLAQFLRHEKNIEYITKARTLDTDKLFYLFKVDIFLQDALNEYKKLDIL